MGYNFRGLLVRLKPFPLSYALSSLFNLIFLFIAYESK